MVLKLVKACVGLILTFAISIGFFSYEDQMFKFKYDEHSETFVGYLSNETYSSKIDTVKGFLIEELTGKTASPIFTDYVVKSELTEAEIEMITAHTNLSSPIETAENVAVYYQCDNEERNTSTCLLKTGSGFHYYVSPQITGEPLTNSYFQSVLDGSKYLNCTSTTLFNMRMINSEITNESIYRQVIKFDNDVAYLDQEIPGFTYEMYFKESNHYIKVYIEHPNEKDGKFYSLDEINSGSNMTYEVYLSKGGERIMVDTLSSMQEITDFMFMMQLDASYFVKTSYGFSMPDNKYKDVCKMLSGENSSDELDEAWETYHVYFNSDYYVTEGRLSASKTVLTMSDGDNIFALTITANYTDFGTTEVTLPISSSGD